VVRKQKTDALEQAHSYVRSARFVRTMQGDTLAKLAAQHDLDVEKLALLNRAGPERVYATPDVACLKWTHRVGASDTLTSLARAYNTTPETLAKLNDLHVNDALQPGTQISVPGEFSYHYRKGGYSYLRIARYGGFEQPVPYDQQSTKMRREKLDADQSLEDLAEQQQVSVDLLRQMNGLDADEEPAAGRWILIEYSVELAENATLDELAQFFSVPLERLRQVNQLKEGEAVQAGQRFQIPIGDRFGSEQERPGQPTERIQVFEVTFSEDSNP
jgi:LysM repeat protein